MLPQPLRLTPTEAGLLARCSLHYHFAQQTAAPVDLPQATLDTLVRETIQDLHAAGGPARLSLEHCLEKIAAQPLARPIIERYYRRLAQDWPQMMAGNELMELKISLAGITLVLAGTVDRLDKTNDGGILGILFRTESGPLPGAADLRLDHAMTIYHALIAATYPHKRPIRLQEWWLSLDQSITIELSEEEYRDNLGHLREPIRALARGEVRARPGLHCETCPFQYNGCPVYTHPADPLKNTPDDFTSSPTAGKIPPRQWIFKI